MTRLKNHKDQVNITSEIYSELHLNSVDDSFPASLPFAVFSFFSEDYDKWLTNLANSVSEYSPLDFENSYSNFLRKHTLVELAQLENRSRIEVVKTKLEKGEIVDRYCRSELEKIRANYQNEVWQGHPLKYRQFGFNLSRIREIIKGSENESESLGRNSAGIHFLNIFLKEGYIVTTKKMRDTTPSEWHEVLSHYSMMREFLIGFSDSEYEIFLETKIPGRKRNDRNQVTHRVEIWSNRIKHEAGLENLKNASDWLSISGQTARREYYTTREGKKEKPNKNYRTPTEDEYEAILDLLQGSQEALAIARKYAPKNK